MTHKLADRAEESERNITVSSGKAGNDDNGDDVSK